VILVEQAAEPVSPVHSALISCDGGRTDPWNRRFQPEGSVGTVAVVVLDVGVKHLLQVSSPDDQQPVQTLGPHRPDPAVGVGVGVGPLQRRDQYLGAVRTEDVVEGAGELRIPIANKEPHSSAPFAQYEAQVAGLLGNPSPSGWAVTPATCTRRVPSSMKHSTYSRRSHTVSTVKKSQATIPAACWRRNARQVGVVGRGAGSSPCRRSIVRIVVAEIETPSCWGSPLIRW
jgi:hypothetical protein